MTEYKDKFEDAINHEKYGNLISMDLVSLTVGGEKFILKTFLIKDVNLISLTSILYVNSKPFKIWSEKTEIDFIEFFSFIDVFHAHRNNTNLFYIENLLNKDNMISFQFQ